MTHRDVLVALAVEQGWTRGVELGLGKGHLFARFLRECPALTMIGVDTCRRPERKARVLAIQAEFPTRATVHVCTTVAAASAVADGSVDFVFIDAGHSYQAVSADIQAWRSKVRPGGWLGGHDYCPKFPGVMQAVSEAFPRWDRLPCDIWVAA